jgi:hypothetical protein
MVWRVAANIFNTQSGQPTRNGPPAWGLDGSLATPHRKTPACFKMSHWVSDLVGSIGTGMIMNVELGRMWKRNRLLLYLTTFSDTQIIQRLMGWRDVHEQARIS